MSPARRPPAGSRAAHPKRAPVGPEADTVALPELDRRKAQATEVIARLEREFSHAGIVLNFGNEWELLVAVILSAQCTDKMVNQVTDELFRKYRTIEEYASADPAQFEEDIRPTGFFRNKTQHIIASAQRILTEYGGRVP